MIQKDIDHMDAITQAKKLIEEGNFEAACKIADNLSTDTTSGTAAHEIRFFVAVANDHWDTARRQLNAIVQLEPKKCVLWLHFIKHALAAGNWDEGIAAADTLTSIIKKGRYWAEATIYRGVAQFKLDPDNLRIQDLETAADILLEYRTKLEGNSKRDVQAKHLLCLCAGLIGSNARATEAMKLIFDHTGIEIHSATIAPYVETQEWCKENGASFRIVEKPFPMTGLDETGNPNGHRFETEEIAVASIPNAVVMAGWDFVITPDGRVLLDCCPQERLCEGVVPHISLSDINKFICVSDPAPVNINEDVIFLASPEDGHFGHWVSDYLPRLLVPKLLGRPDLKIFTSKTLKPKLQETLKAFNVKPSNIIEGEYGRAYRFRTVHFLKFRNNWSPHPTLMKFVREGFRPKPATPDEKRLRLYLNRDDVGTRAIENWQEFSPILSDYGFQSINLSQLGMSEQYALFSRAEIIMGVFGTGLHSMFLIPDEASMIVLQVKPEYSYWHDVVARMIGVTSYNFPCKHASVTQKKRRTFDVDIVVDCQALRSKLDEICENL